MGRLIFCLLFITSNAFGQDIFEAIENGDFVKLEKMLLQEVSTQQYNEKGLTPLWEGVIKNDTMAVSLLLKYDADANLISGNGLPPIMAGCIANSYESVRILIENGADVNWRSPASRNQQPIRWASQGASLDLVKLLLSSGADMESSPDDKGTPLMAALHSRRFEIAAYYFIHNANVDVIGRDGETIIHEAIKTGNPEMVRLALSRKAPLDVKDPEGKTTLQLAKENGNAEITELIEKAIKIR